MFISKEELASHIYEEAITTISRGDNSIVEAAIEAAINEASGYISRFDYEQLFGAVGPERDALLMLYIKDIAKWHFINVCNVQVDLELAKARYDSAIKWLDKVQAGKVSPPNWPVKAGEETKQSPFTVTSNPKRGNYY